MFYKFLPVLILLATICNCPFFQEREDTARKEKIREQIERVDCNDKNRLAEVKKLFAEAVAKSDEIKVEKFDDVQNVFLEVKGKTDETIIVGGHYDKTTLGCGVIDNWSGIVLVANLYKQIKEQNNNKTYKFIAFGKEEKGLIGSARMVENLSQKEREKTCAMINFDSFGFTNLWALENISDKSLINLARKTAAKRNQSFEIKNFSGASSDSKSFLDADIPSITFSGLNDEWKEYLHQKKDQIKYINFDKIFENYLFSVDFLKEIDPKPCGNFR